MASAAEGHHCCFCKNFVPADSGYSTLARHTSGTCQIYTASGPVRLRMAWPGPALLCVTVPSPAPFAALHGSLDDELAELFAADGEALAVAVAAAAAAAGHACNGDADVFYDAEEEPWASDADVDLVGGRRQVHTLPWCGGLVAVCHTSWMPLLQDGCSRALMPPTMT